MTSTPRDASSGAGAGASTLSADQERQLHTAREQGNMRPAASAQRANVGQTRGAYPPPAYGGFGATPFAMMRRMMEDMDRLFSDFGLAHPGALASNFLGDLWPSSQPSRGIGAGSSDVGGGATTGRGQQGLQRGGQHALQHSSLGGGLWSPQVEVLERGNNLVVRADLPGLSREDVDVEIDEDALIIRGHRHSDVEDDQEGFYRSERTYGSFYRAIPLPDSIDPSACSATFRDGVLEVTLPKPRQQQSRAKRIEVR